MLGCSGYGDGVARRNTWLLVRFTCNRKQKTVVAKEKDESFQRNCDLYGVIHVTSRDSTPIFTSTPFTRLIVCETSDWMVSRTISHLLSALRLHNENEKPKANFVCIDQRTSYLNSLAIDVTILHT